jgi:hypothetical protein
MRMRKKIADFTFSNLSPVQTRLTFSRPTRANTKQTTKCDPSARAHDAKCGNDIKKESASSGKTSHANQR